MGKEVDAVGTSDGGIVPPPTCFGPVMSGSDSSSDGAEDRDESDPAAGGAEVDTATGGGRVAGAVVAGGALGGTTMGVDNPNSAVSPTP